MALAGLWLVAFGLILGGYRPGGPVDILVGRRGGRPDPHRHRGPGLAAGRPRRPRLRRHRLAGPGSDAPARPVPGRARRPAHRPRPADAAALAGGGLPVARWRSSRPGSSPGWASPVGAWARPRCGAGASCSGTRPGRRDGPRRRQPLLDRRDRQRARPGRSPGDRLPLRADGPGPRAAALQRGDRSTAPPPASTCGWTPRSMTSRRAGGDPRHPSTGPTSGGAGSRPRARPSASTGSRASPIGPGSSRPADRGSGPKLAGASGWISTGRCSSWP